MTEEEEEFNRNKNFCQFCETNFKSDKVRDHCHLTGKFRSSAHKICNNNVTEKQSKYIPVVFHKFSNYDCHLFFKTLVDKKYDKVKFKFFSKTNEEYISVKNGCKNFTDSYRFLSSSSDKLVKTLVDNSHETLKDFRAEIVDTDELLNIGNEIRIIYKEDR